MYDEGDIGRAGAAAATFVSRGVLVKVVAIGAIAFILSLLLLAPGAKTNSVAAGCSPVVPGSGGDQPEVDAPLRAQQVEYAKLFDRIAVELDLPGRATLVALVTALQESQITNLPGGHADSVGIFQQRPGAGWGSVAQLRDPEYATRAFFGGPQPPKPPGLSEIDGWYNMPLTEAAQAVQVSAFPNAYARHESTARAIAAEARIDLTRPGDPYAGRASRPGVEAGEGTAAIGSCGELPNTGKIAGQWVAEACSIKPDPSNGRGCVTPRTAAWITAAQAALPGQGISCWDEHAWNPSSDHSRGRGCDLFTGRDARHSATEKVKGDLIARWALSTAARTGVNYVIWYGRIWSANTGKWKPYNGGDVYDATEANGGHFNHVHVSLY